MTVAAVVLTPDPATALGDLSGEAPLRRIRVAAWAGGATPLVVVSPDGHGLLRRAVSDGGLGGDGLISVVVPEPTVPHGIGWFVAGLEEATRLVAATRAALLWPFRFAWVDPETVTSLIEAHGARPEAVVRPTYRGDPGFPALVPLSHAAALKAMPGRHALDALAQLTATGAPAVTLELGDPGTVLDLSTPRDRLPSYQGPPEPAGGPPPEWNEAIAARAGDVAGPSGRVAALEGGLAPFDQAEREP